MSHTSPRSNSTHYDSDIYRQTNVPDYEKALRNPNVTFSRGSAPGRDVGLYDHLAMTNRNATRLSSQLRNDQRYAVTSGTRASGHELNYNIPIHANSSYTSPPSNTVSPTLRRALDSPSNNDAIQQSTCLPPDRVYSPPRYRAGGYGEERRNTLYLHDEEPVYSALQAEDSGLLDHHYTTASPSSLTTNSYSLSGLHNGMRTDTRSLDTGHKYTSLSQANLLRKSHQEMTSDSMRHQSLSSLGGTRQLSMVDLYRNRMGNRERTTSLENSRPHSQSAKELYSLQSNMSEDLSNWQQSHKHQLLHQRAETQALSTANMKSPSLGNVFGSHSKEDKGHWGVMKLKTAANEIIHEKDAIIDDLKNELVGAHQSNLATPLNPGSAAHRPRTENEGYLLKMQDLEYQNSSLKSKLSQISTAKNSRIDDLEIQLGAAESELRNIKAKWTDKEMASRIQFDEADSKMAEKDDQVRVLQKRFTDMREEHLEVRKKLERLQAYLSTNPSEDEVHDMRLELKALRAETSAQKGAISDLRTRLIHAKKHARAQEAEIMSLRQENKQITTELRGVRTELDRIKSVGEGAELARVSGDLSRLKDDKERLSQDLEKANKMLERSRRVIQQTEVKHQGQVQQLEERLSQEEEAVTAQREEVNNKEEQIQKLRKSIKELSEQNQDLMMQNLSLKEQLSVFERHGSEESHKLERQLTKEMRLCFVELQSLVQICSDRAEGHDPNMSELLGDGSTLDVDSDEDFSYSSTGSSQASGQSGRTKEPDTLALKHRLVKVANLRKEIRKLRGVISNKLAEDLGKRITCATQ